MRRSRRTSRSARASAASGSAFARTRASSSSASSGSSLAELLVDDLELLREPELALPARDPGPHALVDRPLEAVQLDLAGQHRRRPPDQPVERGLLQQLLPRRQRPAHVRHHPPRPPLRRGRLAHRRHQLRGQPLPAGGVVLEQAEQVPQRRLLPARAVAPASAPSPQSSGHSATCARHAPPAAAGVR
jgi:hypothetical protein